jgi:protein involved in temperature-dependent protein secretion
MNDSCEYIIVTCPNCNEFVLIYTNEINCEIFRHAVFKSNFQQINPHTHEELCLKYINENLVYGCSKPFRIININNEYKAIICDYI